MEAVREQKDHEYVEFISDTIVKMGVDIYISTLFLDATKSNDRKAKLAKTWIEQTKISVKHNSVLVASGSRDVVDNRSEIIV